MKIDGNAPLKAAKETFVAAPIEKIWKLQTEIDRWHEWQPDVVSATLEGALAQGSIFRWKAAGLNITSTLQEVSAPRRIGWTGDSMGMHAIHNWTFTPQANGTQVKVEESLSGWFARLLKFFDKNFLDKSLAKSLETLKSKAES